MGHGPLLALFQAMSPLNALDIVRRSGVKPGLGPVRETQKSSSHRDLGNAPQDFAKPKDKTPPPLRVELVCQGETAPHDPFWDGPRLKPAFVTQFLGQVMAPGAPAPVSPSAYEAPVPACARLLDTQL